MRQHHDITPSASRLTTSLRDIGYDFNTAIADLIDNSISADATRIDIELVHAGRRSWILVADDGHGMTRREAVEALRFGTRRDYNDGELGRFGLGLKTASLALGRRVTVVTRRAVVNRVLTVRTLDLDHIRQLDAWRVYEPSRDRESLGSAMAYLDDAPGTVIVLEKLDRVFDGVDAASGWGQRRLQRLADDLAAYLGMVFHRFLEGSTKRERPLTITINGDKVRSWDPFALGEPDTRSLEPKRFQLAGADGTSHDIILRRWVLPPRSGFSSQEEFERLSGPKKWNRQQGLYLYRSDRLVQAGGWAGLRAMDEHTKLARAALDFPTPLDELFKINVAKMRAQLPSELREVIAKPLNELCALADATYRRASLKNRRRQEPSGPAPVATSLSSVGTALRVAAALSGASETLVTIGQSLKEVDARMAESLGF